MGTSLGWISRISLSRISRSRSGRFARKYTTTLPATASYILSALLKGDAIRKIRRSSQDLIDNTLGPFDAEERSLNRRRCRKTSTSSTRCPVARPSPSLEHTLDLVPCRHQDFTHVNIVLLHELSQLIRPHRLSPLFREFSRHRRPAKIGRAHV